MTDWHRGVRGGPRGTLADDVRDLVSERGEILLTELVNIIAIHVHPAKAYRKAKNKRIWQNRRNAPISGVRHPGHRRSSAEETIDTGSQVIARETIRGLVQRGWIEMVDRGTDWRLSPATKVRPGPRMKEYLSGEGGLHQGQDEGRNGNGNNRPSKRKKGRRGLRKGRARPVVRRP